MKEIKFMIQKALIEQLVQAKVLTESEACEAVKILQTNFQKRCDKC